jgi:hypothetical protein
MQLSTKELDVIEMFLEQHWESIKSIQHTVYLNNECWWEYIFDKYFDSDEYQFHLWESLYESIMLWYFNKFKSLLNLNFWYYDYSYWFNKEELEQKIDIMSDEQKEVISNISYAMYFIRKFNLDLKIQLWLI